MAGRGEDLGEQHEQDDLPGDLRVRALRIQLASHSRRSVGDLKYLCPLVRAGIFVAYWPWFTPEEQVSLAVLADELGLDSVWVAEAWGQDAVSVLAFLAARTERIALGSGLFQI